MEKEEQPINPIPFKDGEANHLGLTKREYFAGLAMQGIIGKQGTSTWKPKDFAIFSIDMADEILKQLDNSK